MLYNISKVAGILLNKIILYLKGFCHDNFIFSVDNLLHNSQGKYTAVENCKTLMSAKKSFKLKKKSFERKKMFKMQNKSFLVFMLYFSDLQNCSFKFCLFLEGYLSEGLGYIFK